MYYWHRHEPGSNAEVDYVIQYGNKIIPVEVKAGATGSLKSLHLFMGMKKLPLAVRINSGTPVITDVDIKKNSLAETARYKLMSIPFYLLGQLHRLMSECGV